MRWKCFILQRVLTRLDKVVKDYLSRLRSHSFNRCSIASLTSMVDNDGRLKQTVPLYDECFEVISLLVSAALV